MSVKKLTCARSRFEPETLRSSPVSVPVVMSLGHSARSLDEFVWLLRAHEIATLIDVRRFAASKRHPHFSKRALGDAILFEGVGYFHEPDLGGLRQALADSPNNAVPSAFRGYADHMRSEVFARAFDRVAALARRELVAVMCAEATPERCHRRYLADALVLAGFEVRHVIDREKTIAHERSPGLRRDDDGRIVYRKREQLSLF